MSKKSRLVNFRVTDQDYHHLKSEAAAGNLTVGEYCRRIVLPDQSVSRLEDRVRRIEEMILKWSQMRSVTIKSVSVGAYVRSHVLPDARTESLEARISRLEMVVSPSELLAAVERR